MQYKVITAELHTRTALHIGNGAGNETTDALIRRDTAGNPIIPGTALAGVLRTLLTRLAPRVDGSICNALINQDKTCSCGVCRLMGALSPSDERENQATASRLLVFNATLRENGKQTFVRDGVGIDRATGAAARAGRAKFDLEILPSGAVFDLRLELQATTEKDEQLLAVGLAEWKAARAWVGGSVNRGMGAFELKELAFKTLNLNVADNLVAFLGEDKPWESLARPHERVPWHGGVLRNVAIHPMPANKDIIPHIAQTWIKFTGTLQATGPLLTNDTVNSTLTGFDHAPLLTQWDDWQAPVLSGASLRGTIRSHAERIARTIATFANPHDEGTAESIAWFKGHCPACNPLESRKNAPLANCDSLLRSRVKAIDEVHDDHLCLACRLFGNTRRGSRLVVEDASYLPTEQQPKPVLKMLDFLAIDRFTGGGADKLKFDALALWQPAFILNIHLENPASWELGWLALVFRDMQEGWLNVGMGAAKGFGQVELKNLQLKLGYLSSDDLSDLGMEASGQRDDSLYTEMSISLQDAGKWVQPFNDKVTGNEKEKVRGFSRGDGDNILPVLPADTYFDGKVDKLYPREVML